MRRPTFVDKSMTNSISNAVPITQVLMNALQFLLSIVGVVAIIGLVIAGLLYLTAGGDMRRIKLAKTSLYASVIGGMISLAALVILSQLANFFS
jgi:hypothetical protein